jgi:hypothetical protein
MRRIVWSALVLVGLCCAQPSVLGAQFTGKIVGHVRDPQQRPIRGATVTIPGFPYRGSTDADGAYTIDSLPTGVYSLRASAPGAKAHELTGFRINAGQRYIEDFILEADPDGTVVRATPCGQTGATSPAGLLLRFQLIRPIAVRTTDKMVMPIDSVLRDLFQWPGYELLSQAAIVSDMPRTCLPFVSTQQSLNANGQAYDLNIQVDSLLQQQLRIHVRLTGLVATPARGGRVGATSSDATSSSQMKILLSTTVTVGLGHTVVLGSTQPGGGRGGMAGTLILTVRPEMRNSGP